ncbi:ArsR/SmtB family transcription factor [Streptomyces albidoflavus]|uniref:ArsR/SmtB family transcription factor n=1 Tax=Streptomyces TaxID=1883 RepID=UPI0004C5EB0B|nr:MULTISPECIES: winged helix-turn-helix domain-containing protein [Streptomyces]MBL0780855.1 winged helix-turn-helix transcriptional regulator [Streptomyces albidoflavus]MBL0803540.1 winged helix-turn-helix transcriptional regulator [Streptomyces albidoflavus]MBV1957095.1 helix-turn-helix domain-containing protein [Streptomyces sp. BV333]MCG5121020.1 helix-turn-helix domain-containing protein [Streptomyces sp. T7(2022)]MCK2143241.1 helix-turn-helix domain-containing protein [Streptomyces sp. 
MLRIHFTPEDLTRVRVAPGPDLLWEISNSVQTLQRRDGERVFGAWRRWARPRLPESRELLSPLLPPYGYSPDFLTPSAGERPTFRAAVEALLGTEPARLRAELARLARSARLPVWAASLARGDTETLTRLGDALHAYQARALVPHWRQIRADVEADRARRLRDLMDGGTEALLSGLGPDARWRPPVLEVTYPVEHCLRLEGRGLVLQPSFFCWPAPTTLADGTLRPVLVHPIRHTPGWAAPRTGPGPLGRLLGQTRAELLRATGTGCSTVEAARMLQVTHPAVSQHMNVLRAAGLITTVRTAGRSFHLATAEGRALLAAEEHRP